MNPQKVSILTIILFSISFYVLASQVSSLDDSTLKQGESLNSSSHLVSANNVFTLGFYSPTDSENNYIAVWYTDGEYYPVWIGNRNNPVSKNSSVTLTINRLGKLIITRNDGDSVELYEQESSKNVSAILLNSGNFVVKEINSNGSSADEIFWQSFDYPTDTLVPGMKLGVNHRTGRKLELSSWFSVDNPASGAFTLEWDPSAHQLFVRRRGKLYWASGSLKDYNIRDPNLTVKEFENIPIKPDIFNLNYNFTVLDEEYFTYSLIQDPWVPDKRDIISAWRLYSQGDLFDNDRPGMIQASLCYGYIAQGSDFYPGCQVWEQPTCRNNSQQTFVQRSGYFLGINGLATIFSDDNSSLSISDCREGCWSNCECVAFYGGNAVGCYYYHAENSTYIQSLDGSSPKLFLLDSPSSGLDSPSSGKSKKKQIQIIVPVVITVLLITLSAGLFIWRKVKKGKMEEELQELMTLEGYTEASEINNGGAKGHDLRFYTYASIVTATKNFCSGHKLGEGGFGAVYKGKTSDGNEIAVKLLSRSSGQGLLEFKTELILISKLQHVNLVKLLGFCINGDDKMIVYDYMPNKSLDFFLFDPSKREQLDWKQRFNIIEGIAQGLLYLHKYSRLKIIHRDLKSSNILLDEKMNPKISDFGLARIFKQETSEANTNRRVGTYGYMAPEYAMQGIFSIKSDVYSFGVIVLEIVSGRKNNSFHNIEGPLNLVEYAWELWKKDSAMELMDPTLKDTCIISQIQICIQIGLLCVENRAIDRPGTEDLISMLKNEISSLPLPKNPAFLTRNSMVEELGQKLSNNELSISEIGGR